MKKIIWMTLLFSFNLQAAVSKSDFSLVISIIHKNFSALSHQNNRKLKFYTNYQSDWAQAFARRWDDDEIHLYGGFARISNASVDSLALIICHELGHLYGGAPYSNQDLQLTVEGMADYWATNVCLPKVVPQLPEVLTADSYEKFCKEDRVCARTLQAALVVTTHFALNGKEKLPSLNERDPLVVEKTLKTHPSSQCRLDTFLNGYYGLEKPQCWMKEE